MYPTDAIDDTVHQRVRLGILAVLSEVRRADFTYMRDALGLTEGNLSRHLQVLENADYVQVNKTFEGRRPRTWISLTRSGRNAFAKELGALKALIERVDGPR
ncbi:MAG TPA: transcriptional regulator [Actinomycetota bacterium]|nr:transcriptional regulator [Actinomycetota bacterium]